MQELQDRSNRVLARLQPVRGAWQARVDEGLEQRVRELEPELFQLAQHALLQVSELVEAWKDVERAASRWRRLCRELPGPLDAVAKAETYGLVQKAREAHTAAEAAVRAAQEAA